MTLAERATMATAVRQKKRIERQRQLNELCAAGMHIKQAAYAVGWSHRSARRWRDAV